MLLCPGLFLVDGHGTFQLKECSCVISPRPRHGRKTAQRERDRGMADSEGGFEN